MRFASVFASAALCVSGLVASAAAQPLPSDPNLVTGQLDNGLRYIVTRHANPPGRAAIWLHLDTGSLNETDKQRGIAHYLEHMAFNGSRNFPPGSVVPFFQSLGMTFGRDQNAFTSFDQTTYQLAMPDVKEETLTKGLTFFADILHRLLLKSEEIDAERGIIQEERRRGLSGRQRTSNFVLEHMAPGSLFGLRLPIGTEETIDAVREADFHDYYDKWYVASNATLIVVADADPADMVRLIKAQFSDAPTKPRPTPQPINVKAYDKSFAIVTSDPEVRSEDVRIVRLEPARPAVTTAPQYRDELVARVGETIMDRRLSDKVSQGGVSFISAGCSLGNESEAIYTTEVTARAAPGKWQSSLQEIALELQRARAFGFTARELEDAKTQITSNAERAVETEPTVPAQALIRGYNQRVADGEPIIAAPQRLELIRTLLPAITLEEVSERFKKEFDPTAVAFIAVLPSDVAVPTEAELLKIGTDALAVAPTQETEKPRASQLMAELPTPGKIESSEEHEASGVWSAWLSNNVRVYYRFMDQRKNEITVNIALIGGELLETAANRGITQAAQVAWIRPATREHSSIEVRDLLNGKKISVRGGVGGFGGRGRRGGPTGNLDAISLSVAGSPEGLETGLQLAHLLLTKPYIEPAAFTQFQTNMRESVEESDKNPMRAGGQIAIAAPFPDDEPRVQPLTVEQVDRWRLDAAQAWLEKLIKESPIEVTVVGDMPREAVIDLVNRYIGSLPKRERSSPTLYADLRKVKRPPGPRIINKTIDSTTPQAYVFAAFYGADEKDVQDVRALSVAARIMSTRMVKEVREEGQLVYSIGAGVRLGSAYPGFGVFSAGAPTDVSKVSALVDKLGAMFDVFAADGLTEAELKVARLQVANSLDEETRNPAYWLGRLDHLMFRGANLDDIVADPKAYQSITVDDVKRVFDKYSGKENRIFVTVKPANPTKPADDKKPSPTGGDGD